MTWRIYGDDISPYLQRVTVQLDYKGIAYDVMAPPGGVHSPDYLALNPIGRIPALRIGEWVLPESEVILEYLEDRHPEPPLRPADPETRARARLVSRVTDLYVMTAMTPLFGQLRRSTRDEAVSGPATRAVLDGLDLLDGMVAGRFAAGSALSLADCAAAPVVRYAIRYLPLFDADPLAGRPRLRAWWESVSAEPHICAGIARIEAAWQALRART